MDVNRRRFMSFVGLAVLPVVGPHMLLSERPKRVGWFSEPEHEYFYYYKGNHWRRIKLKSGKGFAPVIDKETGQPLIIGPFHFTEVDGRVLINLESTVRQLPFTPSQLTPGI